MAGGGPQIAGDRLAWRRRAGKLSMISWVISTFSGVRGEAGVGGEPELSLGMGSANSSMAGTIGVGGGEGDGTGTGVLEEAAAAMRCSQMEILSDAMAMEMWSDVGSVDVCVCVCDDEMLEA